ncbi:MAG TPA: nicotinamide riboside transporter PnuC [Salinivirgaceae bacterium]|nr:nicotinamide riboside transporter PnuC [Salinivirgaceae bacterium]HQA76615.1 nicotinamide riboside transporter PnuC [Salinivirgaceae bacterium]
MVVLQWVVENWIEVTAVLLSFIYMYLSVRQNILLWLFGLISSALYIYVYYKSLFYADMSLQAYYVVISIYGWMHWNKGSGDQKSVKVTSASVKVLIGTVLASLILWFVIYKILKLTNSDVPVGDAFTTAAAIVATWMLARKLLENWLFWIIIDSVSVILYVYKGLWATTLLYVVYTIVAVIGYFSWKRDMISNVELLISDNNSEDESGID